jgi:hypothetical protein
VPKPPPYLEAPPVDTFMSNAVRAVSRGEASEHQQKQVMEFIITKLCKAYDVSFDPGSDRATAFAEGRRFVGLQLVKHINVDPSIINKRGNENA